MENVQDFWIARSYPSFKVAEVLRGMKQLSNMPCWGLWFDSDRKKTPTRLCYVLNFVFWSLVGCIYFSSTFVLLSVVSKPKYCLPNINTRTHTGKYRVTISNSILAHFVLLQRFIVVVCTCFLHYLLKEKRLQSWNQCRHAFSIEAFSLFNTCI